MKTLIIPCAGRNFIDNKPKYLNRHPQGELLAVKTLEGINAENFDKVVYVILEEDIVRFNALEVLSRELGKQCMKYGIVVLADRTEGPAETVYEAIMQANITGMIVVKDLDVKISAQDFPEDKNFIVGLNLVESEKEIYRLKDKSFIIINEQNNVLDIVEKRFCSDIISVGMYGFRKAEEFCWAYQRLQNAFYRISCMYVSHVISYLIGYSHENFEFYETDSYESWGSEKEWQDIKIIYTTYILKLRTLVLQEEDPMTDPNIQRLRQLSDMGASFIGIVEKGAEEQCNKKYTYLVSNGIRLLGCIYDCNYCSNMVIVDGKL